MLTREGEATGVALADGSEIAADVVVSALDPRRTFLRLVDPRELPDDLVEDIRRLKFQGVPNQGELRPGCAAVASGPGLEPGPLPRLHEHRPVDRLPGARLRRRQVRLVQRASVHRCAIQSTIDLDMAPPGKHVLSCFVQYTPYRLRESDWDAEREPMADRAQAALERFFPGFGDLVLQREVQTPLDIERTVGLSEGNIFAGEFWRRRSSSARRRAGPTALARLLPVGSGTHPGGCVMGAPGAWRRARSSRTDPRSGSSPAEPRGWLCRIGVGSPRGALRGAGGPGRRGHPGGHAAAARCAAGRRWRPLPERPAAGVMAAA